MAFKDPERRRQYGREWSERNPGYRRRYNLKRLYDLTPEQYDAMALIQGGRCPICLQQPSRLHVDHDHRNGQVRGLLCNSCNRGIGMFGDSAERVGRALRYLLARQ